MFSSPAPRATPRKSVYRPSSRAGSSTPGPALGEPRARDLVPTPARSRIVALRGRGASPTSSAGGESVRAARYDETYDRVTWSRDERCAVLGLGALPREVQDVLRRTDFVSSSVSGHVDLVSGYAFVSTPSVCAVWNYAKRSHASPTVYPFPAPPGASTPIAVSLHGAADPGIILVSPAGELRLWETLGAALSNVDRFQTLQLALGDGDYVDRLWRIDPTSYLITTTQSQAFRLSITSQAGRLVPTASQITRSTGMFSRSSPVLFSLPEDKEGVAAVVVDKGAVWIVAARTVQKWAIGPDSLRFVVDQDLHDLIGNSLFSHWSMGAVDLTVFDLAASDDGLLALISFSEQDSSSAAPSPVSFAVVVLAPSARSGALAVQRSISIGYVPTPDARQLDMPRVYVQGSVGFVRFADVVVTIGLSPASPFEDVIALKERNAFIGVGCTSAARKTGPSLVLMAAQGGLMGIDTFTQPAIIERKSEAVLATERLKSRMERAVFYGDRADNPLMFDLFSDEPEADVAVAAEQVSAEIIAATSDYMPSVFELRPLLSDRLARLKALTTYIQRNNLLARLPQSSRRRLSRDAEKAKGAIELWDYQNKLMDHAQSRSQLSLLADAIVTIMDQYGTASDDDRIRQFFRTHIQHLDRLLEVVFQLFSAAQGGDRAAWVVEANKIFVIIMRAASQYREDELTLYDVDRRSPPIELWTASSKILDALETLYNTTVQLISDRTRDLGSAVDQQPSPTDGPQLRAQRQTQFLLKEQLTELAAALCTNMEDKLRATSRHVVEGADEQEAARLKRKWDALRPGVIRPLVEIDRVACAYALAEHHSDFETLVWLCHVPGLADGVKGKAGTARLQGYIERFGQEFAFVLYQWYIDQGQQHALLSQDEVYGSLVTKFFEQRGYPEFAWLHHVACGRYAKAAENLGAVQSSEAMLGDKSLIGSIGKLAAVCNARSTGLEGKSQELLAGFDDELESLQVQSRLRSSIMAAGGRRGAAAGVEQYIQTNGPLLASRPALQQVFGVLVQELSRGVALDVEGLIDLLTLKLNKVEGEVGDAAVALDRLSHCKSLPEGRKQVAAMSIWRRVYIRDDWAHIAATSGRSEDTQRALLRGTSAYATLRAINSFEPAIHPSLVLMPLTTMQLPLVEELSARFPEYLPEEVDALMRDHEDEVEVLRRYVDEYVLEERVREVSELVRRDEAQGGADGGELDVPGGEGAGDVQM